MFKRGIEALSKSREKLRDSLPGGCRGQAASHIPGSSPVYAQQLGEPDGGGAGTCVLTCVAQIEGTQIFPTSRSDVTINYPLTFQTPKSYSTIMDSCQVPSGPQRLLQHRVHADEGDRYVPAHTPHFPSQLLRAS